MVQAVCPHCSEALEYPPSDVTRYAKCPTCNNLVLLPTAKEAAPSGTPRLSLAALGSVLAGLLSLLALLVLVLLHSPRTWSRLNSMLAGTPFDSSHVLLFLLVTLAIGAILALAGYWRIDLHPARLRGRRLARAGASLVVINLVLLVFASSVMRSPEPRYRASCQNNLKQLGLVFAMYTNESPGGRFPPLSPEAGRMMFVPETVYPEYLTDTSILVCPDDGPLKQEAEALHRTDPEALIDDQSYFYLGYLITNDDEMRAFTEQYQAWVARGEDFEDDLHIPPGAGSDHASRILRLHLGVEKFLIVGPSVPRDLEPLRAQIPVMWDRATLAPGQNRPSLPHRRNRMNVLYLDGSVRSIEQGTFPYTEETMRLLHELDR